MGTVRIGDTPSMEKQRRVNTSAGSYLVRKMDNGDYELYIINKKWEDGTENNILPKGHKEGSESLEEAATREVQEESGYTDFTFYKYLGSNTYELDWDEIQLKTDHYFLTILNSDKRVEIKEEEYEKGVVVTGLWYKLEEGLKLLTYENQPEIHNLVRKFLGEESLSL